MNRKHELKALLVVFALVLTAGMAQAGINPEVIGAVAANDPDISPKICLNAQDGYRKAKWRVIAPAGMVVTATLVGDKSEADDVYLEKDVKPLDALLQNDSFWAVGKIKTGKYVVRVADNSDTKSSGENSSIVFKFESICNYPQFPGTNTPRDGNYWGSYPTYSKPWEPWESQQEWAVADPNTGNMTTISVSYAATRSAGLIYSNQQDNLAIPYGAGDSTLDNYKNYMFVLAGRGGPDKEQVEASVNVSDGKVQVYTVPANAYQGEIEVSFDVAFENTVYYWMYGDSGGGNWSISFGYGPVEVGNTVYIPGCRACVVAGMAVAVGDSSWSKKADEVKVATDTFLKEKKEGKGTLSIKETTESLTQSLVNGVANVPVKYSGTVVVEKEESAVLSEYWKGKEGAYSQAAFKYFDAPVVRIKTVAIKSSGGK